MARKKSARAIYLQRVKNLRKARAVKAAGGMYSYKYRPRMVVIGRRGGFAIAPVIAGVTAAHNTLKSIKPATHLENFLTNTGAKAYLDNRFGENKLYKFAKRIGNFLTGTLGYGRRGKKRHYVRIKPYVRRSGSGYGGRLVLVHGYHRRL